MTGVSVIMITTPVDGSGEMIAKDLVQSRLVACVNRLSGVRSVYRWQGQVHDDPEELLIAKTSSDLVPKVIERVRKIHPYDEPEIVSFPLESGSETYLAWVLEQTADLG